MFIAYVKQKGEGCDYTIGCGQTLWRLKATTREDALGELQDKVIGKWLPKFGEYEEGYWGEFQLEKILLFEVITEEEMPLDLWYSNAKRHIEQEKLRDNEEKEKAEFERLKKKFS